MGGETYEGNDEESEVDGCDDWHNDASGRIDSRFGGSFQTFLCFHVAWGGVICGFAHSRGRLMSTYCREVEEVRRR